MQRSQERKQEDFNNDLPIILEGEEENEENESAISAKFDSDLEDQEFVQDEKPDATKGRKEEKRNEDLEESETDEAAISTLGMGM